MDKRNSTAPDLHLEVLRLRALQLQREKERGVRYGQLYAPPAGDLSELRRQQAKFRKVTDEISRENSWFAIPALAPVAVVAGLGGAGMLGARLAAPHLARVAPLRFPQRLDYVRVGDNWATRAGRKAHQALKERVGAKPGWDPELTITTRTGVVRPDVSAPARAYRPGKRFQMEMKPDTASGRRAGAKAAQRYEETTGNRTRVIYYNPKDFM